MLELVQARAVDDAGDDFPHVVGLAAIGGNDAIDLARVVKRLLRPGEVEAHRLDPVEIADDAPRDGQGVAVVLGIMVGDAGHAAMNVGAAQVLGRDHLAGGGLDQGRAGQEDGALIPDDDAFVAHGRDIGAAGGARAVHHRDLRNPGRRHLGLIVEDAAEMVAVGEDLVLVGQIGAARFHQIDARQVVFPGDLLGAQMLLDRQRVIAATLHGAVIGDDHAFLAGDGADAGDDAGPHHILGIHVPGGQLGEFEEGRAHIQQPADALARQQFAARQMTFAHGGTAAQLDLGDHPPEVVHQGPGRLGIGLELVRTGVDRAFDDGHVHKPAVS